MSFFHLFFFFFKQKTAYEIASCLVGSEMCIRDRFIQPGGYVSVQQLNGFLLATEKCPDEVIVQEAMMALPTNTDLPVSYTHLTLPTKA